MNPTLPTNKEALKQKPAMEAVDNLISKNQEKGRNIVMQQAGEIQGKVADAMAGMEGASDRISEKQGESGEKGDIKAGTGGYTQSDDDDQAQTQTQAQIKAGLFRRLPSQIIMIKKIRTAINIQIKVEEKKAAQLRKSLTTGGAQEYNASIAKIRTLKQLLSALLHTTLEKVKEAYFRFFGQDGRRKNEI